jgi:hypothetical protein
MITPPNWLGDPQMVAPELCGTVRAVNSLGRTRMTWVGVAGDACTVTDIHRLPLRVVPAQTIPSKERRVWGLRMAQVRISPDISRHSSAQCWAFGMVT